MNGVAAPSPLLADSQAFRSRGRGRRVALGVVIVVAVGVVAAWRAGVFSPAEGSGSGAPGAPAPATGAVVREDLSATTPQAATLGYAGSYSVTGRGGGTLTWLPRAGQVIRQGGWCTGPVTAPRWCCCTAACRTGGRWRRE